MKIKISGTSMEPSLRDGDEVTVDQNFSLEVGKIYLYQDDSKKLICHRYLGDNIFKGDNSLLSETVKKDQIIGLVTHRNTQLLSYQRVKLHTFCARLNSRDHSRVMRRLARLLLRLTTSQPTQ